MINWRLMNNLTSPLTSALLIGLGATITLDLWTFFFKHAFKITPSNYCLVGRWLQGMPEGIFMHSNITTSTQKNGECTVGWIAHYTVGILFAMAFVALAGSGWLQHPRLLPAVFFGVVTVLVPFFIMQPALGLGFAASGISNPGRARLRSLMSHAVFGIGLYLSGLLVCGLF